MTQAQQDAVQKAFQILAEHMEAAVIVAVSSDEQGHSKHHVLWTSGQAVTLGLLEIGKQTALQSLGTPNPMKQ